MTTYASEQQLVFPAMTDLARRRRPEPRRSYAVACTFTRPMTEGARFLMIDVINQTWLPPISAWAEALRQPEGTAAAMLVGWHPWTPAQDLLLRIFYVQLEGPRS